MKDMGPGPDEEAGAVAVLLLLKFLDKTSVMDYTQQTDMTLTHRYQYKYTYKYLNTNTILTLGKKKWDMEGGKRQVGAGLVIEP